MAVDQATIDMYFDEEQYTLAYERAAGDDAEPITGDVYEHYLANSTAMDLNPSNLFDESDFMQSALDVFAEMWPEDGWGDITVDMLRAFIVDTWPDTTALTLYAEAPEAYDGLGVEPVEVAGDEIVVPPPPLSFEFTQDVASVDEGASVTYTVTANRAVDADTTFTYEISSASSIEAEAADFSSATSGTVTIAAGETTGTFSVAIASGDGEEFNEDFTVTLTDSDNAVVGTLDNTIKDTSHVVVDDIAPTVDALTESYVENQESQVVDDVVIAPVVATVTAEDNDGGSGVASFEITEGNDDGYFAINDDGEITLTEDGLAAATNDFENDPNTFDLMVTATDAAGNTSDAVTVTLDVTDIDDTPPELGASIIIGETATLTFDDALDETVSAPNPSDFTVTVDGGSGSITVLSVDVDGTNVELLLGRAPAAGESFVLAYTPGANPLQDSAGNSVVAFDDEALVADSTAPVIEADQTFTYVEDSHDATLNEVGQVAATDDTNIVAFSIEAGDDDGYFAIDNLGMITLTDAGLAELAPTQDFEALPNTFTLTIGATDGSGNSSSADVTITVTNDPDDVDVYTLTNETDVATANEFIAGLVYTPGGDDRINALQDEDELTGQGSNPTLNATLGNANDNGAVVITPDLNGIETVNVAFTGSGAAVTDLDLQDADGMHAANITRVSQAVDTAELGNIVNALDSMSVSNSNSNQAGTVEFSYTAGALAGANASEMELENVDLLNLNIGQNTSGVGAAVGVGTQGYETLTITSTGTNAIGTFNLPMDTGTDGAITIEGTGSLTLGRVQNVVNNVTPTLVEAVGVHILGTGIAQAGGRLATIDAGDFEGDLTLVLDGILDVGKAGTSGVVQDVAVTLGGGDDTIALYDAVQAGDTLTAGEGTDTLIFYSGSSLASSAAGFEASTMLADGSTGNISLDYDFLPDATGMTVRNISANTAVAPVVNAAEAAVTFTMYDMTATQAGAISVQHATSLNNQIDHTIIRAAVKTNTTSDTVAVSIDEGINVDPRGNFTLDTNYAAVAGPPAIPASGTSTIENVTLTDNDSESNSVELNDFANHTGTITINGPGVDGTFLNLDVDTAGADVTANITGADGLAAGVQQGLYGINTDGQSVDLAKTNWSTGNIVDIGALATQVRLGAATINASGTASDVIFRVSTNTASTTGAQTITTGTGDDAVIFDMLNDSHAGLTISDTVNAGDGTDTLLIDGDGIVVALGASEWENVSNFEAIRLVGNNIVTGSTISGQNSYNLVLTNDLIDANGTDMLAIVNDNDMNNDADIFTVPAAVDTVTVEANAEAGVTIDATDLNSSNHFSYNGEEGVSRTADRFIFRDANVNGGNVIDGGALINSSRTTAGNTGMNANADIFEIRDGGNVTLGDLANISNVGTIVLNNSTGSEASTLLFLDDTTIDRMVNSYHAATIDTTGNMEVITVNANDGTVVGATAASRVVLDATGVTGRTGFTFTDDAVLGADDIVSVTAHVTGAVNSMTFANSNAAAGTPIDTVKIYGSSTTLRYDGGVNAAGAVANAAGTITYTTGAANHTDIISGAAANAVGLDLSNYVGIATVNGDTVNAVDDNFTIDASGLGASTFTGGGQVTADILYVTDTTAAATLAVNGPGLTSVTTDIDGAGATAAVTHTLTTMETVDASGFLGAIATTAGGTVTMTGVSASTHTAANAITIDALGTLNIITNNFTPSADAALVVAAGGTVAAGTAGITINLANQTEAIALTGAGGAETLTGGTGDDTITGAVGADILTGGAGNDIFNYTALGEGVDTINDFNTSAGTVSNDAFNFARTIFKIGATGGAVSIAASGTVGAANFLSGASLAAVTGGKSGTFGLGVGTFKIMFRDTAGTDAGLYYVTGKIATAATVAAAAVFTGAGTPSASGIALTGAALVAADIIFV